MFEFAIFVGAVGFAMAASAGLLYFNESRGRWLRDKEREKNFPVQLPVSHARMTDNCPFGPSRVEAQLEALSTLWFQRFGSPADFSDLNIMWLDEDIHTVEPTYQHPIARVPFQGALLVWQTGLAHEAAHHLDHPHFDHRADVYGEEHGLVRLAREAVGMYEYPRSTTPEN